MPEMESERRHPGPPDSRKLWRMGPAVWLATGSWIGFSPLMPGTFGALLGLPLAYGLGRLSTPLAAMLIASLALLAVPVCTAAAHRLAKKDPSAVVLDEIVSVPITFFLHSAGDPVVLAAGFVLHRLFDILKPFPARRFEQWPGGWGIVADDLVAGVYSNLGLWLLAGLGMFRWLAA